MQRSPLVSLALLPVLAFAAPAAARSPGDAIRLAWTEGDVAGFSPVYGPDGGKPIGSVEYHQHRNGDLLSAIRVTRFTDGSSDEDSVEARVTDHLEAIGGRSIIRDPGGEPVVDLTIDVAGGRISGSWGKGDDRRPIDRRVELPAGTYWGPLIFIVIKTFDANADDGQVVFRTVAPTPRPIVLDMVLTRQGGAVVERPGGRGPARRTEIAHKLAAACALESPPPERFGFRFDTAVRLFRITSFFHRHYFRVECHGIEGLPRGPFILVANHGSHVLAWDGAMILTACLLEADPPRLAHGMAEHRLMQLPVLGTAARRIGAPDGRRPICIDLLRAGAVVLTFPEGVQALGRPFTQRYRLAPFGHGFMHVALATSRPLGPSSRTWSIEAWPSDGMSFSRGRQGLIPA